MKFLATHMTGLTVIESDQHQDSRGSFHRLWCQQEFQPQKMSRPIVQASLSSTKRRGTLRGMHYQLPPSREDKLVQVVCGRIYDVAVDLRPKSETFLDHFGLELSASEPRAIFIPAGCAHGFLTLTDDCRVLYMMTDFYDPALSRGLRWNDSRLNITWPSLPLEIFQRDAEYPDLDLETLEKFSTY